MTGGAGACTAAFRNNAVDIIVNGPFHDGITVFHLDFVAKDLDATCERIVELGGEVGERQEWQGFVWRICSDPEGNVFDVMQAQEPAVAE